MNEKINLSYSKLSSFDTIGPSVLISREEITNDGIRHGSLVDLIIVDKLLGTNKFKEEYLITKYNKPKNQHAALAEDILQRFVKIPKEEVILEIIKGLGLWSNIINPELLLNRIRDEEFLGYLKEAFLSKSKIPVSLEEYQLVKDDVNVILNHPFSKEYFKTDKKTHIFLQVPFKKEYENVVYKGILDLVRVKEIDKDTITVEFVDIKTGAPKHDKFFESFLKYRYYLQSAIYQKHYLEIVQSLKAFENKKIILKNFKFLYKCKTESFPVIWEVSDKWISSGLNGFLLNNIYKYKGVYELEKEILFHFKNNIFEFKKEYYENNGVLKIYDDNISLIE